MGEIELDARYDLEADPDVRKAAQRAYAEANYGKGVYTPADYAPVEEEKKPDVVEPEVPAFDLSSKGAKS